MKIGDCIEAVVKGIRSVIHNKRALAKALTLPLLVYLLMVVLPQLFQIPVLIQIFAGVISFFLYVYISVATHRIIIMGSGAFSGFGLTMLGVREWQFLLAVFEVMFYCLPLFLLVYVPYVGVHVATVMAAYIVSRMSLIFPSIAIDAPMNARASWQATSEYQLVMFTVVFVFACVFTLVEYGIFRIFKSSVLVDLFSVITIIFLVGALSEAYKTIMHEYASR